MRGRAFPLQRESQKQKGNREIQAAKVSAIQAPGFPYPAFQQIKSPRKGDGCPGHVFGGKAWKWGSVGEEGGGAVCCCTRCPVAEASSNRAPDLRPSISSRKCTPSGLVLVIFQLTLQGPSQGGRTPALEPDGDGVPCWILRRASCAMSWDKFSLLQ